MLYIVMNYCFTIFCVQTKGVKIMTFSEAYDKLYPREEAKQNTSAEDEKMVETDTDGTGDGGTGDEEQ